MVDGDTIVVNLESGKEVKVRLIGVDTPETVHPRKPVECYGPEASAFLKELLPPGTTVFLTHEEGNKFDHYGRLIAYVVTVTVETDLETETTTLIASMVNIRLILEGYARAYTKYPFELRDMFEAAERQAREEGRGLWSACKES